MKCNGKGKIPCVTCGSRGLIKCATCNGSGSLLARNLAIIRWYVNLAVSNHTLPNFVPLIGIRNTMVSRIILLKLVHNYNTLSGGRALNCFDCRVV